MWKDKFGNVFLTKDEVMQDIWENMDVEDYFEYGDFDPTEILKELIRLENDFIIPKMRAAEDRWLEEHYEEIEDEEEEENEYV